MRNAFTADASQEEQEAIDDVMLGRDIAHSTDYNEQIIEMIETRMEVGRGRYGHGLRVNDDTRQWGTKDNSWTEMGLEEVLDMTIYLCAQIIRIQERERTGASVIHSEPVKALGFVARLRRWLNR